MSVVRFLAIAAVFVALLFLALSNTEPVSLRFFNIATTDSPLAFVIFVAFAAGVAAGLAAGATRSARLKRQLDRLRREARAGARPPAPHGAVRSYPGTLEPPQDAV